MKRIGRPPSCLCEECRKCKRRVYMMQWYRNKTPEQRTALIARRNKELVRINDRRRYDRHTEERRRTAEVWGRKNPEKRRQCYLRFVDRHPEQIKAKTLVNSAIRKGILIRQPCQDCGHPKTQAHHPDYSNPLEVQWLCSVHHGLTRKKPRHIATVYPNTPLK